MWIAYIPIVKRERFGITKINQKFGSNLVSNFRLKSVYVKESIFMTVHRENEKNASFLTS